MTESLLHGNQGVWKDEHCYSLPLALSTHPSYLVMYTALTMHTVAMCDLPKH